MKDRIRQVLLFGMPTNINFKLLQKQKEWLANQPKVPEVEGLLGFLDWFQDTAEFALGKEGPTVVFGDKPKAEPVIFRKWRAAPRTVVALFPEIEAGTSFGGTKLCQSYEHVGQHGGADYEYVIHMTTPTRPEEYADLKVELKQLGYILNVRKHKPTWNRHYKNKKAV